MQILITPTEFRIKFPFDHFLVEQVKKLPDRHFDPINKIWKVPIAHRTRVEKFAHLYRFQFLTTNIPEQDFTIAPLPELTLDIPLKMTLRSYQRGGVAYGLLHKKIINADDMGLGKTGQSIATIVGGDILFQQTGKCPAFPCLVITPNSTKYHWLNQWKDWTGRNYAMILQDNNRRNYHQYIEAEMAKVQIVNYDSLEKFFVLSINKGSTEFTINDINFDPRISIYNSVIVDEGHWVRNEKIKRTKITRGITYGKNYILDLTGTPFVNTNRDVGVQLSIIEQIHKFGGWKAFLDRYCKGKSKSSESKELNYRLNKYCFFRRSKLEVAKELPPKSRQIILCDITNRKEYEAAKNNLIGYLRQWRDAGDEKIRRALRGQVMVQFGILKNISAMGKLRDLFEFIDNTIDQGEKIGIFVHLKDTGNAIKTQYPNFTFIRGDVDIKEREEAKNKFRDDPKCMGIILSIKAAGTGLDGLQYASSTVAFLELPWHAADSDQAEDRFNRIGQTKPVNCLWLLGKDTIDEYIYHKIIEPKRDISDTITGNKDEVQVDFVNEIANLFNIKK